MVSENDSSPRRQHDPWNKGRLIGSETSVEAERYLDHTRPAPASALS